MAVIGYKPREDLPGAYTFDDDAGRSFTFSGPEAHALARDVDRRLAYDPVAPFGSAASVPDTGPAPVMSAAPEPVASAEPQLSQAPPVAQPSAPSGQAPGAAAIPPPAPASDGPVVDGETVAAYALRPRYSPGRAAYDPRADDASRSVVRQARTVSGTVRTPQEEQALHDEEVKRAARIDAQQSQADARVKEVEALGFERQRDAVSRQIAAEQDTQNELSRREKIQSEYNAKRSEVQREVDSIAQRRVDPGRLFRDKGTGGVILAALSVGLGAFGASLTKGPNYAQQIIDNAIDRDIRSQEDQIRRQGAAANNALADISRKYDLTLDESRVTLKEFGQRYAAAQSEYMAAKLGTAEARQRAQEYAASFGMKADEHKADLEARTKLRFAEQGAYVAPRAATGPTKRDPTASEITADANALRAVNQAAGGDPEQRKAKAAELHAQSEERRAKNDEEGKVQKYGERKAEVEQAGSVLQDHIESMGGAIQKDGTIKWSKEGIAGTGQIGGRLPNFSAEAKRVERTRAWLIANVGKQLSGASVSPQQQQQIETLLSATDEQGAREGAETLLREQKNKLREIDASFGDDVASKYETNRDEVARRKTKATKGTEEEPF